jgi:hypothetical protein
VTGPSHVVSLAKAEMLAKYFSSVFTEEPEGDIPNPKPINIKEKMPELIINEEMALKQNLKGGLWFFVSFRIFFLDNTRVRILLFFVAQSANFFSKI